MKKFVLIAVLLQLCLSVLEVNAGSGKLAGESVGEAVNENQVQFGDLLVFPDKKFSHYAVYVGGVDLDGKLPGQNIFEMTNDPVGCRFHKEQDPFRRHNYLDPGIAPPGESMQPQSREDMIRTIQELRQKDVCQTYSLRRGNCEQIATKVRYGKARCKQEGTNAASLAKFLPNPKLKRHDASAAA